MDKKSLIIIVLSGIILLLFLDAKCVINIITSNCETDTIIQIDTVEIVGVGAHCDDTNRYNPSIDSAGGGALMSIDDARLSLAAFKSRFNIVRQKGVIISKRAIDEMFDINTSANTLVCSFGINAAGEIQLFFDPINCKANMISNISAPPPTGGVVYYSESICPEWCGVFE